MATYKLTNTAVKNAKLTKEGKPVKLFDGGGLYLHVKAKESIGVMLLSLKRSRKP